SNRNQYQLADTDLQLRTTSAKEVLRLAQLRYKAGYSAYLEVLDAQRTANDAELALVRNRTATLQSSVDLMRALGGGW
ncbi:TolC family protein, partial [Acinetobacter baumannii]